MTQNFGGAILPVCQTFSDTHTVEVSSVIAGKVTNTNLVICHNTSPTQFTSDRNAFSTNAGATIAYQWYRTTDVARTVWQTIAGATKSILKAMANNKGLVLAGIGGGVAYQVGKSKGRRDQGEILQSKMLPARYRNIQY